MIKKYKNNFIEWIDVEVPKIEEIKNLMSEYDISSDIACELQLPTYKEKIVVDKNYIYLVLHFPTLRHTHKNNTSEQEIDFIIGKNFLITTRYEHIDALEKFSKIFELNNLLNKDITEENAIYIFYHMIKEIYKSMSDEIDSIDDTLKQIEKDIFKNREKEMVIKISKVNRDLISFNHIILTHRDVLFSLKDTGGKLFGGDFIENFSKIINEYYRIEKVLHNNIDFLKEIRETNDSLLSSKQNEIIKILTVITFLSLPFFIITGFFQMNTIYTPFINNSYSWQIIIFVEIIVVSLFFLFAKWRKWI
ncbi:MAG: CorA family divalent cation transporter [bacterium]